MNRWRFIFVLSIVQAINGLRFPSFFSGYIRIDKNNAGIAPRSEAHRAFEVIEHSRHQHQTGDSNSKDVTFDNASYQNIKKFYFFPSFRHCRFRRAAHNRSLFGADQTSRRKFNCYMLPLDGVDGDAATDDETWIDMKENANGHEREWEKQHVDVNSCSDSSISSDERVSNPAVSGPASSTSDDPSTKKAVNLDDNDGEEDKLSVTVVEDGLDSLDRSTITRESLFQIIEDSWQRVEKLIPAETLALCESDLKSATSLIVLAAIRRTADTYPERSASRAVAEGMLQAADRNNDGQLSVSEWFDWLSAGTRSYSSAFRRRQEESEVESREKIAGAPGKSREKRVVAAGSGSRERQREVGGQREKQEQQHEQQQQQSESGSGSTVPLPQTMADGLNEVLGHSVCSLKVIARMSNDPAILSAAFVAGGMVSGVLDEGVCRNMLGRMSPFARELVVHALSLESASSLMSTSVTATTSLHSITGTDSSAPFRSQPSQPRASPPMVSTSSSTSRSRKVFSNSSQSRNEELISEGVEADSKPLTVGRKNITSYDGDSGSVLRITNSAEKGLEYSSNGYGFTSENITRGMTSILHGSSSNKTQMAKKQQIRGSERPEDMAQLQSSEEKEQQEQQRLGNEREQKDDGKVQLEQQKRQLQLEVGRARARKEREKRSMVTVDLSEIPIFTAPPIDDDAKSVLSSTLFSGSTPPSLFSSAFPSLSSLSPPSFLGQAPISASFTEEESVTAARSAASFPPSPSPSYSLFNRTDILHPDPDHYPPVSESQNIPAINDTVARFLTRDQFYVFHKKPLSTRLSNGEVDDSENGTYKVNKSDIKSSRDGSVEIEGIQDESEDEGGIITTTLPRRFSSPTSVIQSLIESSPSVGAFLPVRDVWIEQRLPSSYYTHLRGEWVPVSLAEDVTRAAVQSAATVAPNPFSSSESDNSLSIDDTQTASPLTDPDSVSRTAESIAEYIAEDQKKRDAKTDERDVFSRNLDPLDIDAQTAFASNAVLQQGYIEEKKKATDHMPSEVDIDHIEGAVYVPSSRNSRKLPDVTASMDYSVSSTEKPAAVDGSINVQRDQDAISAPAVLSRKKGAARSVTISAAGTILTSESEVIFGDTSLPSQQGYPSSTSSVKRRRTEDQHRVEDSGVRRRKINSGDEERLGNVQDLRSRIVGEDEQGIELKQEKGQQLDGLVQRMGKVMREAVKLRSSLQDLDDPQASLMRQSLYESSAHRKDVLGLVMALRAARLLHARRLPPYARHQLALDTLQLWSPLSFQVGLAAHTPELEVHSYVHLFPQSFGSFINWYHAFRPTAKSLLRSLRADLEYHILNDGSGILPKYTEKVEIQSRLKTPSSAFKKMLRGAKVKDQLFDIIGLRSIIREKPEFRGRLVHPTSSLSASCILHSRPDAAESRSDDDSFKATMNRTENGGSTKVVSNSTANIGGANGVGNSVSFTRDTHMRNDGDRWVETDHVSITDNFPDVRKGDEKGKRTENKTCDGISEKCGEALDDEGIGEGQRGGAESEGLVDVEKLLVWRLYEILSGLEGWRENTHRFKDYVNYPKPSGYQSLHVSLQHIATGIHMEVQIRSERMHWIAEHGTASHSNYKALVLPPANDAV